MADHLQSPSNQIEDDQPLKIRKAIKSNKCELPGYTHQES